MNDLLKVTDLVKRYPLRKGVFSRASGYVRAVDGVSFSIAEGKTLGLVGESGCGKTTVGRAILRLIEPDAGEVVYDGRDLLRLNAKELKEVRRELQIVFQDPYSSLNPRMLVGSTIEEPILVHGQFGASLHSRNGSAPVADKAVTKSHRQLARDRAIELLQLVGLSADAASRYPHELSGGQRQRVCIARALTTGPRLIVCDEPVSALDVSVQAQVLNLLADLQQRLNLTYLFISHDLGVVKHISDEVAVMYLGEIVEYASTDEIFLHPLHPYTRALLESVPEPNPKRRSERKRLAGDLPSPLDAPSGCRFHPRCPIAIDECKKEKPPLIEITPGHKVACLRAGDVAETPLPISN